MTQAFLEAGQHRFLVPGLHVDHPIGTEPNLRDRRRKQVRTSEAPQHLGLAVRPGGDPGGEEGGGGAVQRPVPAAGNFVQRAQRQSTSRQMPVDFLDAEREHRPPARGSTLETLNALSELLDDGTGG